MAAKARRRWIEDILAWLRKTGKPFFLVVNKTDGLDESACVNEFSRFGVETVIPIAAAHQRGIPQTARSGIAAICRWMWTPNILADESGRIRVAFVGRPNVGKSTLVNRLLGEERMIASDVPGTTRDSIAVDMERDGRQYRLIDTAGLRRRAKVEEAVEKFSVFKTLQAIENCQVAVVMLDAGEGVTEQDATVLGHVLDAGRALVIAVNKWDGQSDYQREQTRVVARPQALVLRLGRAGHHLRQARHRPARAVQGDPPRARLGDATNSARRRSPRRWKWPMKPSRRRSCAATSPSCASPIRAATIRRPSSSTATRLKTLTESYRRYLENFFRKRFKLVGTPVKFMFKEGVNPYEGKKNVLTDKQVEKQAPPDAPRQGQVSAHARPGQPGHSRRRARRSDWAGWTRPASSSTASHCCRDTLRPHWARDSPSVLVSAQRARSACSRVGRQRPCLTCARISRARWRGWKHCFAACEQQWLLTVPVDLRDIPDDLARDPDPCARVGRSRRRGAATPTACSRWSHSGRSRRPRGGDGALDAGAARSMNWSRSMRPGAFTNFHRADSVISTPPPICDVAAP